MSESLHHNDPSDVGSEGSNEDHDLRMSERDHQQHEASIRTEAYRQALSEIAGELYVHVYSATLQAAMARQRQQWNLEPRVT